MAGFNLLLAVAMVAIYPLDRQSHYSDMLAHLARHYTSWTGPWGERLVRVVGGLLLLSATNTAVNGLMSIVYIVSRDGELPAGRPPFHSMALLVLAQSIGEHTPHVPRPSNRLGVPPT